MFAAFFRKWTQGFLPLFVFYQLKSRIIIVSLKQGCALTVYRNPSLMLIFCLVIGGKSKGYAIQGLAGSFALHIVGFYSAAVGVPFAKTVDLLRTVDYPIYENWEKDF